MASIINQPIHSLKIHNDAQFDNIASNNSFSVGSSVLKQVETFYNFIPEGVMKGVIPPAIAIQQYVYKICSFYDPASQNTSSDALFLPKLTSALFTTYIEQFAQYIGFSVDMFSDINTNITLLANFCTNINQNPDALATTNANTLDRQGEQTANYNVIFGPPQVAGLVWNLNPYGYTGNTLKVYQTLRVLYTTGTMIGYFYQHHHLPWWVPAMQTFAPGDLPFPQNGSTYHYIPYSNANTAITHYTYANTAVNSYAQPGVQISQGIDCTNFTMLVNYLALGLYYSANTQEQAFGSYDTSATEYNWMIPPPVGTVLSAQSVTDYAMLNGLPLTAVTSPSTNPNSPPPVLSAGGVVVQSPGVPLQQFNSNLAQVGDVGYLALQPVTASTQVSTVSHGIINLGWPYVIDSDNFINTTSGVFVRNIEKIQAFYPNGIFNNMFIVRRFVSLPGAAPVQTYSPTLTAAQITAQSVQV